MVDGRVFVARLRGLLGTYIAVGDMEVRIILCTHQSDVAGDTRQGVHSQPMMMHNVWRGVVCNPLQMVGHTAWEGVEWVLQVTSCA